MCWTLSAFLSTQKSAQKSKNTQKSAFESKFTLLSAQKSAQKSGFAKSKKDFPHVTLVFEDGKWVEAHKMILAASAWQKQASADMYEGNSEQGSRLVENLLNFYIK